MSELHHEQCPWHTADRLRTSSVCGCPPGWPKDADEIRHKMIAGLSEQVATLTAENEQLRMDLAVDAAVAEQNMVMMKMRLDEANATVALLTRTQVELLAKLGTRGN